VACARLCSDGPRDTAQHRLTFRPLPHTGPCTPSTGRCRCRRPATGGAHSSRTSCASTSAGSMADEGPSRPTRAGSACATNKPGAPTARGVSSFTTSRWLRPRLHRAG
jgi:hypothetical protein